MKYKVALTEKNVKKEDLSIKQQAKIDAIEKLVERLHFAPDDEKEQYETLIEEMDAEMTKSINKFNLEVHKRRLESIAKLKRTKVNANGESKAESPKAPDPVEDPVETPVETIEHVEQEEQEQQNLLASWRAEQEQEEQEQDEIEYEKEVVYARKDISKSMSELSQKAQEVHNLRKPADFPKHPNHPEEIQDFQKAQAAPPKSKSKKLGIGLIILGGFLALAGVNLVRSK